MPVSPEILSRIYDESPVAIEVYDAEGRLLDANRACLELFGIEDVAEIRGFSLFDDPNVEKKYKDRLLKGKSVRYTIPFDFEKVKKGQLYKTAMSGVIYLDILITPISAKGRRHPEGYIVQLRDIAWRKHKEQEYRTIIETAHNAFWLVSADGRMLDVNDAACHMLGYGREELANMHVGDFEAMETPEETARHIRKAIEQGGDRFETRHRRKDGGIIDVEVSATYDKKTGLFFGFIRDITERKRMEETLVRAIAQAEDEKVRAEAVIAAIGDAISIQGTDFRVLYQNQVHKDFVGNCVGRHCYEAYEGRDRFCEDCPLAAAFNDGGVHRAERSAQTERGNIHVDITASPIRDFTGKIIAGIEVVRDITERKAMERTLRESEEKWRSLVDNAPDIIMTTDVEGTIKFINQTPAGLTPEEAVGAKIYDYVPPEYQDTVRQSIAEVFRTGTPSSYEIAARGPHGVVSWYTSRVGAIKGDDGSVDSVILITRDISRRKQIEDEMRVKDNAIATSINAIAFSDPGGILTYVNKSFLRLWGYESEEEVIGKSGYDILRNPGDVEAIIRILLESGGWTGEVATLRKDGSVFTTHLSASLVRDGAGNPIRMMGSFVDLTEQKRLEEKLRAASITDELTGLLNRRGFMALAENQLSVSGRSGDELFLVFADFDNLKSINDRLGHRAGDRALVETAGLLRNTFRKSDIIGRVGGDEFALLLVAEPDLESETAVINRFESNVEAFNRDSGCDYALSISTGVVRFNIQSGLSLEELMKRADTLMYEEKKRKR